jgi:glycosyltransferase involved in cell wall biosynthesis
MRVLIYHNYWNHYGGEERVNATVAELLLEHEHEVIFVSRERISLTEIEKRFRVSLKKKPPAYSLGLFNVSTLSLYRSTLLWALLQTAIFKEKPDVIWLDNLVYKIPHKLSSDRPKWVFYIHYPTLKREILEREKKYNKKLEKFYFDTYRLMYNAFAYERPEADIYLCNSNYVKQLCTNRWGVQPVVLYPPVDVENFFATNTDRQNIILTLGRIVPWKNYEEAIFALAKAKTKPKLYILGALRGADIEYYHYLKNLIHRLGLSRLVRFIADLTPAQMREIMSKAKVIVHPMHGEHFGIAVVEAMASGCVPIVHKSGGPYLDITDRGQYGIYYNDVEELAQRIDALIDDKDLWLKYHRLAQIRAQRYDKKRFKENTLRIFERLSCA